MGANDDHFARGFNFAALAAESVTGGGCRLSTIQTTTAALAITLAGAQRPQRRPSHAPGFDRPGHSPPMASVRRTRRPGRDPGFHSTAGQFLARPAGLRRRAVERAGVDLSAATLERNRLAGVGEEKRFHPHPCLRRPRGRSGPESGAWSARFCRSAKLGTQSAAARLFAPACPSSHFTAFGRRMRVAPTSWNFRLGPRRSDHGGPPWLRPETH